MLITGANYGPAVEAYVLPAILSVVIVSLLSLVGSLTIVLGFLKRHLVLLALVALAAGTLLGDAFFHLIPEAVASRNGFSSTLGILIVTGFLAFFLLETGLRWGHAHGEEAHPHEPPEPGAPEQIAPFAWTNLVGDGLHNFVDGALLAAAYIADIRLGVATTIAVAAHEIPQELGDFAVLLRAGLRPGRALAYNLLSALLALVGTVVILILPLDVESVETVGVPLIAGGFVYIAAADLVPELHHHSQGRYVPVILAGLLLGVGSMIALLGLEIG